MAGCSQWVVCTAGVVRRVSGQAVGKGMARRCLGADEIRLGV